VQRRASPAATPGRVGFSGWSHTGQLTSGRFELDAGLYTVTATVQATGVGEFKVDLRDLESGVVVPLIRETIEGAGEWTTSAVVTVEGGTYVAVVDTADWWTLVFEPLRHGRPSAARVG
jgi:hypothetical protein